MLSNAAILFFIIDPFGLIPLYASILQRVPEHRRQRVLLRELGFALIALILFLFAGKYLLAMLGISQPAMTIAGAIILFLISVPMIFPSVRLSMAPEDGGEPFIVPLAMPLFAGPSALAMVMLIGSGGGAWGSWMGAVFLAWLAASILILLGNRLAERIGKRGLIAMERLMGMLLVAISVEMILTGITEFQAHGTEPMQP